MNKDLKSIILVVNQFRYILTKKQKRNAGILFLMTIVAALLEMLGVSLLLPLIQVLLSPEELLQNKYIGSIMEFFNIKGNQGIGIFFGIAIALVYIGKNAYMVFFNYEKALYGSSVQRELSVRIMKSYMQRNYTFFMGKSIAELQRGAVNDVYATYVLLSNAMSALTDGVMVASLGIVMLCTDWTMTLGIMALALLCFFGMFGIFRKTMQRIRDIYNEQLVATGNVILQAFNGIKEIQIMRRQKYFSEHYEKEYKKRQSAEIRQGVANSIPPYLIEAVCVCGLLFIVLFKIQTNGNAVDEVSKLAIFAVGAFRILPALGRITANANMVVFQCPMLNNVYRSIREVDEYEKTHKSQEMDNIEGTTLQHGLKLENVTWRYPGSEKNILDSLSLEIKKGESVAFIGQSGAGKTTLADVILGILHPQSGTVCVDGQEVYTIPNTWSRMIGYVPQNAFLTNGTIRENVAFGIERDDISDEQIWNALEQAQLKEFVQALPDGLDTKLGERGIRFSGGQRQRIVIARALYYDPEILVLDEATSALDNETETAVMEAIDFLQGSKTLIIIAHRLSTIKNCDKIYEIKDGKAVLRVKEEVLADI